MNLGAGGPGPQPPYGQGGQRERNLIPDDIEHEGQAAVQNFIFNEIGEKVVDIQE